MKPRFIPTNVMESSKIFGFKKRNLIEGLIWAAVLSLIIYLIPFVFKIKIVLILAAIVVSLIINGFGIRGQAISKTVINFMKYKYYRKRFPYRRLNEIHNTEKERSFKTEDGKVRAIIENKPVKKIL